MTLQACGINEPAYRLIMAGAPPVDTIKDGIYLPETDEELNRHGWGVFTRDRRLAPGTAYFRGPGPHLPIQRYVTDVDLETIKARAPDHTYIYGGRVVPHYGHFLLGSLPRFWNYRELTRPGLKILIHSPHSVPELFSHAHIRLVFGAIGLTANDFVRFVEPVAISSLITPWPSFEEGHLAYESFATLCHDIGRTLLAGRMLTSSDRPVYFSKEKMVSGISRLVNEGEMTQVLQSSGVDVVFPETLDLRDQIAVFAERAIIAGSFGSVFHSSIFVPRRTMLMLNWGDTIYRNFSLIDHINGNDTHYLFPNHDIEPCGDVAGFSANWRLLDPERTARQLLTALEALAGRERGSNMRNLALGRPTTQSTYAAEHQPSESGRCSMAVSGRLTAKPAFHTSYESNPWWQVDLGHMSTITRVRLYNVVGPPLITERASNLRILISADGLTWTECHRRLDPTPFGGIDGTPFEWEPIEIVTGRFIRVQLLQPGFFHLDQVQVFGMAGALPPSPITPLHAPTPALI